MHACPPAHPPGPLQVCTVRPLAMTPSYLGPIMVTGRNMGGNQDGLFCRLGGAALRSACF